MNRFLFAALAVFLLHVQSSRACDAHLIPVIPTVLDGAYDTSVNLNGQFSDYDPPKSGGHDFENLTTTLTVGQRVGERWSVQVGLPYIDRTLDDTGESGIGDVNMIGVFRLYQSRRETSICDVDVYAGVKAPTGDTDPLAEEKEVAEGHGDAHHAHGHHLALGSGSWDGIFGALAKASRGLWSGSVDVQYILRTEGDYDFEYGDEYYIRGGIYRQFTTGEGSAVLAGVVGSGEWSSKNNVIGETQEGSDKSAGYAGPVITYQTVQTFSVSIAYDFPVYNTDDGLDGAADSRVRANLSYLF